MTKSNPLHQVECLTLSNLMPSEQDKLALQAHSKAQRLAHFNLCTILLLTSEDPADRKAALKLRELFRKNTLDPKHNKCDFDKTTKEKALEAAPIRPSHDSKNS